ncbi:MAG TPA: 5'-deoxynucleotidase [Candidatus Ruthenibacterium merdavium]|uniref:5'-deoxynucleotidase n=1 Tax=Candidatus Ruthenibacterium merdavium TaxID=2838752 RepID=A0A9D2TJY7_9FIRM|nr:5'-deoxynucleotidase [Candidatus Ruthenibacterium merdavium]
MKLYPFNALLARMKYIARWGLMRSSRTESVSEHTADTAILAHTLCLIANKHFAHLHTVPVRPETVAVAALYHDAGEIMTGDLPTPVKYKNEPLLTAFKELERDAAQTLCTLLPPEISGEMHGYLTGECLTPDEQKLLKAADRLSALIKCIDEEQAGSREFLGAKKQQSEALRAMQCPEAEYFMKHMLPCYRWTLDELSAPYAQEYQNMD